MINELTVTSEQVVRKLRIRRLEAAASGNILATAAAVASIVTLMIGFDEVRWQGPIMGWTALATAFLALRLYFLARIVPGEMDDLQLLRATRRLQALLVLTSLIWAVGILLFAYIADGLEAAILAVIGTVMFIGVLPIHRTPPAAAYFHIIVLGLALFGGAWLAIGPAAWLVLIILSVYALVLWSAVGKFDREFRDAVLNGESRDEASATVSMLLNEYEEQSTDWLWTVDPRGNLRNVGARFAAAADCAPEDLEGQPITRLFQPGEGRDALARHIIEARPFRDLLVSVRGEGELQYWRLSARPREDGRMSGVARDVTADRLIEERVAFMAHYDNLTGLANRYLFNERLRALTGEGASRGANIALFYLDLDDFKAINDTRGHLVGDRVLREVGTRLEQEVRNEDMVARLGGDEFAVLIETRAGDGLLIERAHRFLSVVRAPYEIEGHTYRVSTSVGVARCNDGDCDAEEIMRRADLALYAAKSKGRDNLALFEPSLDRAARERREIENDLRDALTRGQMRLHYQPIIELNSGATTGYEALLRWYHPQRGIIGPGDFLPVAEETGLIMQLGEWVIREALREVSDMQGDFRIAINLSPTQVKNPNLVATVAQAIHATGIAAGRIELEITEHVLMDENAISHATLMRLRDLGVRIALDDFGTGYSSLAYLRRFPFDRIKIDRAFVVDVVKDLGSQAIVSTITRLADALGMDTTAEGIESRQQLDLLRKLGVQEAQGFLICEPALADAFSHSQSGDDTRDDPAMGSAVLDYRKARSAVRRRRGGEAA